MHLEILEDLLNVAALLGGLGGVENDSQRDAPLIGIEKRSPEMPSVQPMATRAAPSSSFTPKRALITLSGSSMVSLMPTPTPCPSTSEKRPAFRPSSELIPSAATTTSLTASPLPRADADDLVVFLDQPVNHHTGSQRGAFGFGLTREPLVQLCAHNRIRLRDLFGKTRIEVIDGRRGPFVQAA